MGIEYEVPQLINLPVHRDIYLSQQRADKLCKLLWQEYPRLVGLLANEAQLPYPNCRFGKFRSLIEELHIFFRDQEKAGNIEHLSLIAMVDLSWEVDRRIRHGNGVDEISISGRQLAPSPSGPFPKWQEGKISNYPAKGMTQALSDELSRKIYEYLVDNNPDALFAMSENERRELQDGEAEAIVLAISKELTPDRYNLPDMAAFWEFSNGLERLYMNDSKTEGEQ